MEKVPGYDYVDGKYVLNAIESEIVKFTFTQNQHYHEEPPAELIEIVYKERRVHDRKYTMEMAREDAKSDSRIIYYVTRDVNEKFKDYLAENRAKETQIKGVLVDVDSKIVGERSKEIIDKDTFHKAMKAKKDRDAR